MLVSLGQGLKRVMLNKICTMKAKTHAIPALHPMTLPPVGHGQRRDSFSAKVPGHKSVLPPTLRSGQDRVTQPPHIAGPLGFKPSATTGDKKIIAQRDNVVQYLRASIKTDR